MKPLMPCDFLKVKSDSGYTSSHLVIKSKSTNSINLKPQCIKDKDLLNIFYSSLKTLFSDIL